MSGGTTSPLLVGRDHHYLVSIVVACFNQAPFVEACLDSLARSSYTNVEVLIIDDGSDDGSHLRIEHWITRHPEVRSHFVRHCNNRGFTRRLNEAIERARGEFIAIMAADDVMLSDGIAKRVAYLETHPQKLAVFGDSRVIDDEGKLLFNSGIEGLHRHVGMRRKHLLRDGMIPYSIVFSWAIPGPVFLCRRCAFSRVGRYDEALVVEDWDMYLRLAAIGGLGFVNLPVADYRVHGASLTSTSGGRMALDKALTAGKNAHLYRGICRLYLETYAGRLPGRSWRQKVRDRLVIGATRTAYRILLGLECVKKPRSARTT